MKLSSDCLKWHVYLGIGILKGIVPGMTKTISIIPTVDRILEVWVIQMMDGLEIIYS